MIVNYQDLKERNVELEQRIAELEDQNMRLRLALLELKERYSCSPWIHRQVDEAIRKEIT